MYIQVKFITLVFGALCCASAGALATVVTSRFVPATAEAAVPLTQATTVPLKMKSLGYFLRHDVDRSEKIAYCENNPGIKISDPECENARLADAKLGISTKAVLLPMFPE